MRGGRGQEGSWWTEVDESGGRVGESAQIFTIISPVFPFKWGIGSKKRLPACYKTDSRFRFMPFRSTGGFSHHDLAPVAVHGSPLVHDLSHRVHLDAPRGGALDAVHVTLDGGVDGTVLKGEVTPHHLAVDEGEVLAVAQGLGALDAATDEGQILGIPGQIFPLEGAVADGHVFGVPEGILGVQHRVGDGAVLHVLEGILALQLHARQVQSAGHEEGVLALHFAVGQLHPAAKPAELGGADLTAREGHAVALAESLDAPQGGVLDGHIGGVPQSGAAGVGKGTVHHSAPADVPEGVAEAEFAVLDRDIRGLLQGGFPVGGAVKEAILHRGMGDAVEGALLVQGEAFVKVWGKGCVHMYFLFCMDRCQSRSKFDRDPIVSHPFHLSAPR